MHTRLFIQSMSNTSFKQYLTIEAIGGDGRRRNCTLLVEKNKGQHPPAVPVLN